MALPTIKHRFTVAKADGPDSTEVRPSNWNDTHDFEIDGGKVIGRDTSGTGEMQELPISVTPAGDVALTALGYFLGAVGTSAQRPGMPVVGMIRFNTDLGVLEVYGGGQWNAVQIGTPVPVGATMGYYSNTAPTGWLFVNGQTIGDGSSGATNSNAAFSALFQYLWNNLADAQAPVGGGRGGSALADWSAHKTITLPDECGRVAAGSDSMGGIPSKNRLTGLAGGVDGDILGGFGGEEAHLLTVPEIPAHHHAINGAITAAAGTGGGGGATFSPQDTADTGGGLSHNNVQPTIIKNVIIKY